MGVCRYEPAARCIVPADKRNATDVPTSIILVYCVVGLTQARANQVRGRLQTLVTCSGGKINVRDSLDSLEPASDHRRKPDCLRSRWYCPEVCPSQQGAVLTQAWMEVTVQYAMTWSLDTLQLQLIDTPVTWGASADFSLAGCWASQAAQLADFRAWVVATIQTATTTAIHTSLHTFFLAWLAANINQPMVLRRSSNGADLTIAVSADAVHFFANHSTVHYVAKLSVDRRHVTNSSEVWVPAASDDSGPLPEGGWLEEAVAMSGAPSASSSSLQLVEGLRVPMETFRGLLWAGMTSRPRGFPFGCILTNPRNRQTRSAFCLCRLLCRPATCDALPLFTLFVVTGDKMGLYDYTGVILIKDGKLRSTLTWNAPILGTVEGGGVALMVTNGACSIVCESNCSGCDPGNVMIEFTFANVELSGVVAVGYGDASGGPDSMYFQLRRFNASKAVINLIKPRAAPQQLVKSLLNTSIYHHLPGINEQLAGSGLVLPTHWGSWQFPAPQVEAVAQAGSEFVTAITACSCQAHVGSLALCNTCPAPYDYEPDEDPQTDARGAGAPLTNTSYAVTVYSGLSCGLDLDDAWQLQTVSALQDTQGQCQPMTLTGQFYMLHRHKDTIDASIMCGPTCDACQYTVSEAKMGDCCAVSSLGNGTAQGIRIAPEVCEGMRAPPLMQRRRRENTAANKSTSLFLLAYTNQPKTQRCWDTVNNTARVITTIDLTSLEVGRCSSEDGGFTYYRVDITPGTPAQALISWGCKINCDAGHCRGPAASVPLDACFSLPGLFGGSPGDNYILQSEVPGCLSPPRPAQTLEIVLPICAIVLLLLGFACIRRRWDRSLRRLGIKAVAWLGSVGVAVAAVLRRLAGAVARIVQRAKYWPGRLGIQFQPANLQVYYGPSEADKTKHREIIAKAKISAILIVCCYAGLLGCFIGTRYYRGFVSQLVNTLGIHTSFLSVARLEDTIVGRCQAAIAPMPCLYIP